MPNCPYCKYVMQWNSVQNIYSCPRCGTQGAPYCPSCLKPVPVQSRGAIGCMPQNPGFAPQRAMPQQNGAMLAA